MSLWQMIALFGVTVGLCAIAIAWLFERLSRRGPAQPFVAKTTLGGLGIGALGGVQDLVARIGQQTHARRSLNTSVMVPTAGLRVLSLGPAAVLMLMIWGPMGRDLLGPLALHLGVSTVVIYGVLYIANYEVRYDAEGITAPNWLFQDRHHRWEDLINLRDNGHYLYRLRFKSGEVSLQKYLVGMPAFLTFMRDIETISHRR